MSQSKFSINKPFHGITRLAHGHFYRLALESVQKVIDKRRNIESNAWKYLV